MLRREKTFLAFVLCAVAVAGVLLPDAALARRSRKQAEVPETPETVPTPQRHLQEGLHYYQGGQLDMAQAAFQQAIAADPRLTEAFYMLGMVAFNRGDFPKAEGYFQEALRQNTFFTDAHNALGLVYQERGQPEKALEEWQIVLTDRNYPTPEVAAFNVGKVYLERGSFEQAAVFFRRAASTAPQWGRAWYALGFAQEEMGSLNEARVSYERAVRESEPTSNTLYKIHYRLGLVCFKLEDPACARENFGKVMEIRPLSPESDQGRELLKVLERPNPYRGLAR
jgi:tetratricopeptide (TPR) repeat protein